MSLQTAKPLVTEEETSATASEAETQSEVPGSTNDDSDSFVEVFPGSGSLNFGALSLKDNDDESNEFELTSQELRKAADILRNADMGTTADKMNEMSREKDTMQALRLSQTKASLAGIRSILEAYQKMLRNPNTRQKFLNAAVFCAFGGRRSLRSACQSHPELRVIEGLRNRVIVNGENQLNIALMCRLGHIILWKSQEDGGSDLDLYAISDEYTPLQIGSETLWGSPRRRGNISVIKWKILGDIRNRFIVDKEGFEEILELLQMT